MVMPGARVESIDVRDLPEPVARAVEAMVNALRRQIKASSNGQAPPTYLPLWTGSPTGSLTRQEIYDDGE